MTSQEGTWPMEYSAFPNHVITWLLASGLAVLGGYYLYVAFFKKETFSWTKYGIPHADIKWTRLIDFRNGYKSMIDQYGDKVGYGCRMNSLLTTDLDLLKNIMVKDFSSGFSNRSEQFATNSLLARAVFFSSGQAWNQKRHLLSPNFSTAKLKFISKIANEKAKRLGQYLVQCAENNRLVLIKRHMEYYTAEVIAQTAFGCQVDCLKNGESDDFITYCRSLLKNPNKTQRLIIRAFLRFHWLHALVFKVLRLSYFDMMNATAIEYFRSLLKEVISQRLSHLREGRAMPVDFLQMSINASELLENGQKHDPEKDDDKLTMKDVLAEMILTIHAGFETTSTALQFILYFVAQHQHVQDKVVLEIREKIQEDTPTFDELTELTYTKQVIDESLRLYPPAPLADRAVGSTRSYGDVTLPAKTRVVIPIFLVHRDPKNWPNPEEFDPDRFAPEENSKRHPFSFMPFGMGPRQCLGLRLAYMEIKLALVHVLRKVKVKVNEHTTPPAGETLKLSLSGITAPVDPIELAVVLREQ